MRWVSVCFRQLQVYCSWSADSGRMKIKRLDIVGFKSFVDKVSLDFQQGITGVVGPNGCGKSNIVDAIRWSMGEQNARFLRGQAMEDVIFGGSESRKPHGLAEVSVVFDNSAKICPPAYRDYAEIMVTRRLYRSGESEYLLNKTPCRLLDITELFMDTGVGARAYSIIEQGKVGMLVSAKPAERRNLIEEAAGVTKYKLRKKTALRKMDATRQNLVRLSDIISEVRRQLSSLKRQAQRAEKFREYRGEAKRLELSLTGNKFQRLQAEIALVSEQEQDASGQLAKLDARLEQGELQLEERQLGLTEIEAELSASQERVYKLAGEIQRVEGEQALSLRQREQLQAQSAEQREERALVKERLTSLAEEIGLLQEEQGGFSVRLENLADDCEVQEEGLRQALSREQALLSQLEERRRELMELLAEANRLTNRREEIKRRLESESDRRQQLKAEAVRLHEQQVELDATKQQLDDQLQTITERQQLLTGEREQLERRRQQLKEQFRQAESDLTKERQQTERCADTPWTIIAADLLRVKDPADEVAIEMALGERLQAVPVASLEAAEDALRHLQQVKARATLLLPPGTAAVCGFSPGQPLLELVQAKSGAEVLVQNLLAGTFLVDDLRAYWGQQLPAGALLVAKDGSCLNWRGELTAGRAAESNSGLLSKKRQLEELAHELTRREEQLQQHLKQLARLQDELEQSEAEEQAAAAEEHQLELQSLNLKKDRQGVQAEVARLAERLELIEFDREQIGELCSSLEQEGAQLAAGSQRSSEQQQQLEEMTETLQVQLAELRGQLDEEREQLTEKRVALAALRQQQQGVNDTLERLAGQQQELQQRQQQLQQRQQTAEEQQRDLCLGDERLKVELELLLERHAAQQQASQQVRERYEQQRAQLDEQREQLRSVRLAAEDLRKQVARLQLRQHELQMEAEHVRQGVQERYRVDLHEHQVPEATEDELERERQQLKRLQQRIESLGEVNLMAIDEYREQEERYDFLTGQRDDLQRSLDDLQKAISQINRTTRRRFKETFDQVNEKFRQVFPRLFRGGQAELRLMDEEDLLETGIEIIVQPPGKRLQNVNLLSGGEKALTAVALIFSLFLIKPTPFCVLDEVDAPLDDANIDRFAELVREMTDQSQFIIITHSKRTMTIVDTMYGVTMQEPGVSKLVSVRINDPEAVSPPARAAG